MADSISTTDAARRLETSTVTVRHLIARGHLSATKEPWGSRFRWLVDAESVERVAKAGVLRSRPRRILERIAVLERDIAAIQRVHHPNNRLVEAERDDLRAKVITLEDTLARMRTASELQRAASEARANVVSHFLAATSANEVAEKAYRRALEELEEALAGATGAGHLGQR